MLVELRRAMVTGGTLVVGFFDSEEVVAFDHQGVTAYSWPVDELSARLSQAGFRVIERLARPGVAESGRRPHAAVAAIAH